MNSDIVVSSIQLLSSWNLHYRTPLGKNHTPRLWCYDNLQNLQDKQKHIGQDPVPRRYSVNVSLFQPQQLLCCVFTWITIIFTALFLTHSSSLWWSFWSDSIIQSICYPTRPPQRLHASGLLTDVWEHFSHLFTCSNWVGDGKLRHTQIKMQQW